MLDRINGRHNYRCSLFIRQMPGINFGVFARQLFFIVPFYRVRLLPNGCIMYNKFIVHEMLIF